MSVGERPCVDSHWANTWPVTFQPPRNQQTLPLQYHHRQSVERQLLFVGSVSDFVSNHQAEFRLFHLCYYVIADAFTNHFHSFILNCFRSVTCISWGLSKVLSKDRICFSPKSYQFHKVKFFFWSSMPLPLPASPPTATVPLQISWLQPCICSLFCFSYMKSVWQPSKVEPFNLKTEERGHQHSTKWLQNRYVSLAKLHVCALGGTYNQRW